MRRQYESQQDRDREQRLISLVSPAAKKMPKSYRFDFFVAGPPVSVWEVKWRSKAYSTWFVALSKLLVASMYESVGIQAWALVEMAGTPYRLRMTYTTIAKIEWGGRTDRGDKSDMEPIVHYRVEDMIRIER